MQQRAKIVDILFDGLSSLRGLKLPKIRHNCTHVFYSFPILLDIEVLGINRQKIVNALKAEGVKGIQSGYANIHMLPIFQKKIAMGNMGFPWSYSESRSDIDYDKGICPVAEQYQEELFLNLELDELSLDLREINMIVDAFRKVWDNLNELEAN